MRTRRILTLVLLALVISIAGLLAYRHYYLTKIQTQREGKCETVKGSQLLGNPGGTIELCP